MKTPHNKVSDRLKLRSAVKPDLARQAKKALDDRNAVKAKKEAA